MYNDTIFEQIIGRSGSRDGEMKRSDFDDQLNIKRVKRPNKIDNVSVIIRMNITDSLIHVYAQNGSLLKRINYRDVKKEYGDPICCSNDGRLLVFRQGTHFLEYMHHKSTDQDDPLREEYIKKAVRSAMLFNIIELSPNGLGFMKTIDVYEGLELFFKRN
jgi:hypothetical protein